MDSDQFINALELPVFASRLVGADAVAVGVSGGPDSMALALALVDWAKGRGVTVHVLTVDHRLRPESADEALRVGHWFSAYDHVVHRILVWDADKEDAGLQAQARQARYDLMGRYCRENGVSCLFTAHHQDDQFETVLFRLAKGSGLTGLGGMRPVVDLGQDLYLLRPLLDVSKADLISFCEVRGQAYFTDPGNEADYFARGRLRQSVAALEAEGLTGKRVSVTAARLRRADEALQVMAQRNLSSLCNIMEIDRIALDFSAWRVQPEEIALRQILMVFAHFYPDEDYFPRMEKVESLVADLLVAPHFRKRSLGGAIFERNDKRGEIVVTREETLVSCGKAP
jgi:tRNA(Ile)-lysidine synthase